MALKSMARVVAWVLTSKSHILCRAGKRLVTTMSGSRRMMKLGDAGTALIHCSKAEYHSLCECIHSNRSSFFTI